MARISRRQSLGGGAAVLGGLLAAACGEPTVRYVGQPQAGPAGPAGPAGAKGESGAQGAQGAQGAAGAAAKPPQTITFWTIWWNHKGTGTEGPRAKPLQELVDRWNAQNDRISVVIEPTPPDTEGMEGGTTAKYNVKVIAAYTANQQPDFLDPNYFQMGTYGPAGMLVDLNTFIKKDKEYAATLDDFYPHVLASAQWRGQMWGIPWHGNADLPYTNLTHLQAAGLQPLKQGYTWDDLVEYTKTLQQMHGDGDKTNKYAMGGMTNQVQFWNLIKQAGGDVYSEDFSKATLNSSAGVDATQFISDMLHKHRVHGLHGDVYKKRGVDRPDFRKGQYSMYYETGSDRIVHWAKAIGGMQNIYITPPPTKKQTFTGNFGSNLMQLKTNPERQEAAWQVLRWLTMTDQLAHWQAGRISIPVRRSVGKHPLYREKVVKGNPPFQTFIDQMEFAYRPFHPLIAQHYGLIAGNLQPIWKSPNASVKDILDETARKMDTDIQDFSRKNP